MSENSPKAPVSPAKGDANSTRNVTVQDLFDGTVLDTGDLDASLRKTREIKVAIKRASGTNNGVPVQPTHTDSDCLRLMCAPTLLKLIHCLLIHSMPVFDHDY